MKIKGSPGMVLAAAALAMAFSANAAAQQGNIQHKYTDDTIIRDLKAGKLTVREAQILENRRNHRAAVPAATPKAAAKTKPPHAVRPVKATKSKKTTSIHKHKSKAPIRHLTHPAGKSKISHPHRSQPAHAHAHGLAHGQAEAQAHGGTAVAAQSGPVRKTAVRYIR